jgi:hypothetical protein
MSVDLWTVGRHFFGVVINCQLQHTVQLLPHSKSKARTRAVAEMAEHVIYKTTNTVNLQKYNYEWCFQTVHHVSYKINKLLKGTFENRPYACFRLLFAFSLRFFARTSFFILESTIV